MAEANSSATGSIYDLGYRPYEGERLGRRYAVASLYVYSLRAVFGLGRSAMSKAFPFGLAVLALIPAAIQLAIAAVAPEEFSLVKPENHFGYVQIVVALFCAVVAPEVIGRDQRYHTLPLYFSRAMQRTDYVSAKLLALVAALLAVLLIPQALLLIGSAVSTQDITGYLKDNLDQIGPIIASSVLIAVFMSGMSLVIASQTPRRAFASGAVLAYFIIFTTIGSILIETTTGDVQRFCALISPFDVMQGTVHWLFNADPPRDSNLAKADLAGPYFFAAALVYSGAAIALLYRRFQRLAV